MRDLKIAPQPIVATPDTPAPPAKKKRPKTILEAFENIVELARGSGLSDEFMALAATDIRYASRRLGITRTQAVLMALFVNWSEETGIRIASIAEFLDCRTIRVLRLSAEIDILVAKHYLRRRHTHERTVYRVPIDVIDALKRNEPYTYELERITDPNAFFAVFARLYAMHSNTEMTYAELKAETMDYLDMISSTHFATEMRRIFINHGSDDGPDELMLFIFMAHLFVANDDNYIRFSDIEDLYDNDTIPHDIYYGLRERATIAFETGLIENTSDNGIVNPSEWRLTERAKTDILAELHLERRGEMSRSDLTDHKTITAKTLVYNPEEERQVKELAAILAPDRFAQLQGRLADAGMRTGFCCLFHGSPGTGKTETALQIARLTGRDIMRVDVDKVKNCWVGESEKAIRAVFERYRAKCSAAAKANAAVPILFFNEADALLGLRMEGAQTAVNKMENSIQNIILQEMETLEGIMIATTNLTANLDRAFERRFLYKVSFSRPGADARGRIWQAMVPDLAADDAVRLAADFDLSGGEIENAVRRATVAAILNPDATAATYEALAPLCRSERLGRSDGHARVGF